MASGMSCNLQRALSRSSDGVRRRSRACILAPVANSEGAHVYNAFGFDLVHINFEDKFFRRNCQDFIGFRHDLRSDHDVQHSMRSEERRVGKECRSRCSPYH